MGEVIGTTPDTIACEFELSAARHRWLEKLDRDPSPLHEYLSQRPTHRLGMYFEQLWRFFLIQDCEAELIAHNLPVHQEGKTLGEFDCIYYCHRRRRHVHLELAVKFFLATPHCNITGNAWRHWLGPDCRDRLDLKLNHLLTQQIKLSDHPAGSQVLRDLGIVAPAKEIAFKGYLFKPWSASPHGPPAYNNANRLQDWIKYDQVASYTAQPQYVAYSILPKMRWLCAAPTARPDVTISGHALHSEISKHFEKNLHPLLVAAISRGGAESCRFFVVPDTWPDLSR